MAKRAVLYARVSGDDRHVDGRNLGSQIEMCREYARQRGYTVVAELSEDDRGARGADFDLPMLTQALIMARSDDYDVLVVRELDRFARRLTKQIVVEEELKRSGVLIEYVLGEYPDTPEGRLNKHIQATVAEWEREKVTERLVRGRKNAVRRGSVLVQGKPPYGYRVEKGEGGLYRLVIDPEEARIVRQIYQWYTVGDGLAGPFSLRTIAHRLSADAAPSPGDRNRKCPLGIWSSATVGDMLSSTTYVGTWFFGKRNREERYPRSTWMPVDVSVIIDRSTWEAAQERRRVNQKRAPWRTKRRYLLRRRVACGCCGLKLAAFAVGPALYYGCPVGSRRRDERTQTCNMPSFRADQVDFAVWSWLKNLLTDPVSLARKIDAGQAEREAALQPLHDRLDIVNSLLADNRRQLSRLLDLYLAGDLDKTLLVERKNYLERTVAGLEAERGNLAVRLAEQEFSTEQVETLQELAAKVRAGLALIDDPNVGFPIRQQIVDLLDVRAILKIEDGVKIACVTCRIDVAQLSIVSNAMQS
jgi:site-specific DNA recombinase